MGRFSRLGLRTPACTNNDANVIPSDVDQAHPEAGMPKLHTLDAMRGVAATMVAAHHFGLLNLGSSPYLAVDFFFALSGFVIAYSYDRRLSQGMTIREFLTRRLIRLYPLLIVGLSLGLLVSATLSFGREPWPKLAALQFVAGALLLPFPPIFGNESVAPLNGPYWSLLLEIYVNIVFVLVFRWLRLTLLRAIVGVFAVALVVTAFSEHTLETGYLLKDFHYGIARVGFSFFAGVLLCRVRHRVRMPRLPWLVVLLLTAALLLLPSPGSIRWIYDSVCVIVLFPLLLLCGASVEPAAASMRTFCICAGGASYAIYALHRPFTPILNYAAQATPEVPFEVWSALFLLGVILLAVAADRLFDIPVRRWLADRRGAAHRRAKPP